VDGDGDPDAYLAHDMSENQLLRNDGGFVFTDIAAEAGVGDYGFGMGVGFGDVDADGDMDLFVSNMESHAGQRIVRTLGAALTDPRVEKGAAGNTLFLNQAGSFSVATEHQPVLAGAGWAWGGQLADLDLDGRPDVHVLSGYYTAPELEGRTWEAKEHDC
jgi:hypothetical protein